MFVTCAGNLEPLLSSELQELGIPSHKGFRGVYVSKTLENVYRINYLSRLATRVLWPLKKFSCRDRYDLYDAAKTIDWDSLLTAQKTFAIDAVVSHPNLKNSLFAALVVKDAICDLLRDKFGARPSVDLQNPDVQLHLFIQNQEATISLDTSGQPLHKRGWRTHMVEAPLQETLAAAILRYANYSSKDILCDPFCGSGTFLLEAALMATHTPPGYFRKTWGFFHLPEHDEPLWNQIKSEAGSRITPLAPGKIFGSDPFTAKIARAHTLNFPIQIEACEIRAYRPPSPTLVVANPPFGKRIAGGGAIYRDFHEWLQQTQARTAVLSPEREWIGRYEKRLDLKSGGLPISVYLY